jgi:hypothetical protein
VKGHNDCLTGEWKIHSFHGIHSCNDIESKQQRYYKSSILDYVSPSLEVYFRVGRRAVVVASKSGTWHNNHVD